MGEKIRNIIIIIGGGSSSNNNNNNNNESIARKSSYSRQEREAPNCSERKTRCPLSLCNDFFSCSLHFHSLFF
jgi:hypothetical protein